MTLQGIEHRALELRADLHREAQSGGRGIAAHRDDRPGAFRIVAREFEGNVGTVTVAEQRNVPDPEVIEQLPHIVGHIPDGESRFREGLRHHGVPMRAAIHEDQLVVR